MVSFSSEFIKTEVTALKFCGDFLFAGIGSCLNIYNMIPFKTSRFYNVISGKATNKKVIFNGENIQGITINDSSNFVLLNGRNILKLYKTKTSKMNIELDENPLLSFTSDWVLSAKWLEGSKIAIILAHNQLCIYNKRLDLEQQIICEENCLLYSSSIAFSDFHDLVILSGAIFSEILIWKPSKYDSKNESPVLKRLTGHKGVIFDISFNEKANCICSVSDDRSAILWQVPNNELLKNIDQSDIEITPKFVVSDHLSRIFRCLVLDKKYFITAGEDSLINIWNFNKDHCRQFEAHQGAPVWSIDVDRSNKVIASGGSDCGIVVFPKIFCPFFQSFTVPDEEVPRKLVMTNNFIVCVTENGKLYQYEIKTEDWSEISRHEDLEIYVLLEVSKCRNQISLSGYNGIIYIYKELDNIVHFLTHEFEKKTRIFSFHWLLCDIFLICQDSGRMILCEIVNGLVKEHIIFTLPNSKERWLTSACLTSNSSLIVGDRNGNIYLYKFVSSHPVQIIRKAHNYLGVTHISFFENKVVTLGRNYVINTYDFDKKSELTLVSSDKTPISWLSRVIDDLVFGFSGSNFVLWDSKIRRTLFKFDCSGGHRSWNFSIKNRNLITFGYIKSKVINLVEVNLSALKPCQLVEPFHTNEINSITIISAGNNNAIVSGGEDTILRVSFYEATENSFHNLYNLKSHLSSIRVITKYKIEVHEQNFDSYLVASAGGRAQIILWKLDLQENKVTCTEEFSYYKKLGQINSEMRIMDLCIAEINSGLILSAACSDGNIKLFSIRKSRSGKFELVFLKSLFYSVCCIFMLKNLKVLEENVLLSAASDGKLVFWDMNNPIYFKSIPMHQSGINSCDIKFVNNGLYLILTGGDDNAIRLNYLSFMKDSNIEILDCFKDVGTHCTQISGVFISDNIFITSATDQRLAVFSWKLENMKLHCKLLNIYYSTIADIKGMQCLTDIKNNEINVFLHGKGLELIKVKL